MNTIGGVLSAEQYQRDAAAGVGAASGEGDAAFLQRVLNAEKSGQRMV